MPVTSKFHEMVDDIVNKIGPHLHGCDPQVQGAVIADLYATYMAGHVGPDKLRVRQEVTALWLRMVFDLVEHYEEGGQNFPKKNSKLN